MPKTALADTLAEWDSLFAAMDSPEILDNPHMQELRAQLEATIRATKALADEQASLQARRQAVTQQLRITRRQGQDVVIRLRAALRSLFGHRYEGLVRYQVRPVRRRSRAKSEELGITPAATEAVFARLPKPPAETEAAPPVPAAPTEEV